MHRSASVHRRNGPNTNNDKTIARGRTWGLGTPPFYFFFIFILTFLLTLKIFAPNTIFLTTPFSLAVLSFGGFLQRFYYGDAPPFFWIVGDFLRIFTALQNMS